MLCYLHPGCLKFIDCSEICLLLKDQLYHVKVLIYFNVNFVIAPQLYEQIHTSLTLCSRLIIIYLFTDYLFPSQSHVIRTCDRLCSGRAEPFSPRDPRHRPAERRDDGTAAERPRPQNGSRGGDCDETTAQRMDKQIHHFT